MGVTTFTDEFVTPVAPERMFKAVVVEGHNIIPKLMPEFIKSIELVEGDGGAGTIWKTVFNGGQKSMKNRIDALDTQNLTCKYTYIEGDSLRDELESICYHLKFEASGNRGCIMKTTCEYNTKGDVKIKEEDIKAGKGNAGGMSKVIEEYLLKNPSVCA